MFIYISVSGKQCERREGVAVKHQIFLRKRGPKLLVEFIRLILYIIMFCNKNKFHDVLFYAYLSSCHPT